MSGAVLWFVSLAWFFVQAPQAAYLDLIEYHLFYRGSSYRVPPPSAYVEGLWKLYFWLRSAEGLPRTVLALVAVGSLFRRNAAEDAQRSELGLAAAIAAGMVIFASTAHPTFDYYFVLAVPFLAILSCNGAWRIANAKWIVSKHEPFFSLLALVLVTAFLRTAIWNRQFSDPHWGGLEQMATLLNSVVPRDQPLYASDEAVYFLARRFPLPGLENNFGSELDLPPDRAAALRVVPQARVDDWIRSGRFAAVWLYEDDPRVDSLSLASLYARRAATVTDVPGFLFWERIPQRAPALASAEQDFPNTAPDAVPASK